ncbi:MAG: 4-phosphopantoate--beta-alanine ligase [Candidatus Thermoplasmatota archaeon]
MDKIPLNHPRYHSLMTREKIARGMRAGFVHETGLIAHGRGEAFDYLFGEQTQWFAEHATKTAAACLLCAHHPIISVNGNVAALVANDIVRLSKIIPAGLEVNLFHRTRKRVKKIIRLLHTQGASFVYGLAEDARIPHLDHDRAICDKQGIFSADVILVPLEDGDRCQALRALGKVVITIDLNPLSRTAKTAHITIVDNVTRAVPNLIRFVNELKSTSHEELQVMVSCWDNQKNLQDSLCFLSQRLKTIGEYPE